jgi:CubicO group peptidase (beta-lactamase class C family)
MATIQAEAVNDLKSQIDAVTKDPEGIPGTVYCAVNRKGELIFQHASGKVGVGQSKDMSLDTVFWIASCTKMITGIACMQLVEQGKWSLDDVGIVEKLAPVRKTAKVLDTKELGLKYHGRS